MDKKKLLSGLEGVGISVSVRSLAEYMAGNGVLVVPTVGRQRGHVPMPGKAYGLNLDAMSEDGGAFYRERVSQGHLCFVPREDEAALGALEKRLRRAVENRALAEGFMPLRAYDSLKKEFEDIRTAYFQKRDEILARWDTLLPAFESGVRAMLADIQMPAAMREQVMKEFLSAIPEKEAYAQSFTMSLRVHAFPAESGLIQGLDSSVAADVRATWSEQVVSTAILSIEKMVSEGWSKLASAMRQYLKGGAIKASTEACIQKLAGELEWKNVFRNPLLTELAQRLHGFAELSTEEQAYAAEDGMTAIYGYAVEAGLDLDFANCPYTVGQLNDMLRLVKAQMNLKGA